ncbi:MAG: sugar isomerase [Clostridia bacterium]|nr:sugar isomerase [Clostridia bacterium]
MASLQALYAPVGKNDRNKINSILAATHHFYKTTGTLYTVIIVAMSFIYPAIIHSSLDYFMMVAIFFILGIGGAFPYFIHSKYALLLQADGKSYILTIITQIKSIVLSLAKLFLLLTGQNVILVESIFLLVSLLHSLSVWLYVKKKYQWIDVKVEPDLSAVSQKNSVLIHQISSLIFTNTDVLLLTFFCDLKVVSVYTLYKYMFGLLKTFINNFSNSINFKLGQVYQHKERFIKFHDIFETFHVGLTFGVFTVAYLFVHPFLALYTEGMDADYLLKYMPLLMLLTEVLDCGRVPLANAVTFAGHFKQTQWRSIFESVINLASSVILVQFMGIYGVLLGTVLALGYRVVDMIIYVNRRVLDRSAWNSAILWLGNSLVSIVVIQIFPMLSLDLTNYFSLIAYAAAVAVVVIPSCVIVSYLLKPRIARDACDFAKSILRRRKNG